MKKLTLLSLIFFSSLAFAQTVPPQGVNFQAVLFDEFGTPVPSLNENSTLNNQSAEATFTFYNFSSGLNYYSETHSISTDEYGRFQVVLGRGTPLGSNTFQDIVWSDGNIFLDFEVALNGQSKRLVSSQELLSVPYALFAGGIQGASDLDPDPSNEIQELAIDADSIYITKGNAVPVPLDGDKSSSNELQSISVSGNQITISNGNTVTLPAVLDASPTNELQNLSTQGDSLTITNGNTVITDPSSTNELQNLSVQANDLTITGGNTVALPVSLDNDSTNEIQGLELSSNGYLKLSKTSDSIPYFLNYDTLASNLLKDTTFTSALSKNQGFTFECVDMGVSALCYSLGIDSTITLKPYDSYTYSISSRHISSTSNISQQVNWRKFKVTGIDTNSFEGFVFKYKRNKQLGNGAGSVMEDIMVDINPDISTGDAYFYVYAVQSRQDKSCGTSFGGACVSTGRLASVPVAHTWVLSIDCWTSSNSTDANDIEILYKDGFSLKHTGLMFDFSIQ